jgi:hypothetical protein
LTIVKPGGREHKTLRGRKFRSPAMREPLPLFRAAARREGAGEMAVADR